MGNRFFEFYNDELVALRKRATRFAEAYPKIAGRLRLGADTSDDPHVERLVQSFAYSAAHVRQKLDDSLPELTNGLLETLYPHYLAPTPSFSLITLTPAHGLENLQIVPRGTELNSDPIEGDTCRFVTTQDIHLAPIKISELQLMNRPFEAPQPPSENAVSCLRLSVEPTGQAGLDEIGIDRLRFYLSGPARQAQGLARLLTQHCKGVALSAHSSDGAPNYLRSQSIVPIGFEDATGLIPYPEGSFPGYRILTEFSCLPEKFLFFDLLTGPLNCQRRMDVYFYFDATAGALTRDVNKASIILNTAPIVNLFPARAEPVLLDGTRPAYPLQADARRPFSRQVHSVRRVTISSPSGAAEVSNPFFHRQTDHDQSQIFWQLNRHGRDEGRSSGTTSIAFVDHRTNPIDATELTASVEVLATNGDLPNQLPFGGGQPRLRLASAVDNVAGIECLKAPTPTRHAPESSDRAWQLISHLSLNHLSISAGGAAALREILRLYDMGDDPATSQAIDAIDDVAAVPGLTKLDGVLVSGTDVTITFDSQRIEDGQAVLFGSIIDRFLGCYTTINTFSRLTLRYKGRTDVLASFPARSGQEALL